MSKNKDPNDICDGDLLNEFFHIKDGKEYWHFKFFIVTKTKKFNSKSHENWSSYVSEVKYGYVFIILIDKDGFISDSNEVR